MGKGKHGHQGCAGSGDFFLCHAEKEKIGRLLEMRKEGPICLAPLFSLKPSLRESPRFQSWVADSGIMKKGGFPADFALTYSHH